MNSIDNPNLIEYTENITKRFFLCVEKIVSWKEGGYVAYIPLTKSEEKLMQFLWEQGKPLSASEIQALWKDNAWTKSYTRDIIRALEEKGAIEFYNLERTGKNYGRRFRTVLTRGEYFSQLAMRNGVTVTKMFKVEAFAMVEKGNKQEMDDLIRELEGMIEEYRARDDDAE